MKMIPKSKNNLGVVYFFFLLLFLNLGLVAFFKNVFKIFQWERDYNGGIYIIPSVFKAHKN
jgi:hypothetical protein